MKSGLVIILYICTLALAGPSKPGLSPGKSCTKSNEKTICRTSETCVNGHCRLKLTSKQLCAHFDTFRRCLEDEGCKYGKCAPRSDGLCIPDGSKLPPSTKESRNYCCRGLQENPATGICHKPCTQDSDCLYMKFYRQIQGECVNNFCERPKPCGNCGDPPVDGRCCDRNRPERYTGLCSCPCKTEHDCNGFMICDKEQCVQLVPGRTCGDCDQMPIRGQCCKSRNHQPGNGKPCYCDPRRIYKK